MKTRRAPIRRSLLRSRPIDPRLNDPLEELWKDRPADKEPIVRPRPTSAIPISPSDARSLEIQAQIEAEARRSLWQETYGKSQRDTPPAPGLAADRKSSAGEGQIVQVSSPSVLLSLPPGPSAPLPQEPPARLRHFTPMALNSLELIQW